MDSRIYQKNQEFDLGNGLLNINLYNGRMLYNYEATSISNGNYQISSGLVYNSHYRELGNKVIGFGNGWKYDFEEFVFKYKTEYNLTGFNENDYVYIDSNWCIHRFVKYISCNGYDVAGDAYYDESGTGLKLVVLSGQNYKMYDEYGNTYTFDNESGKIIEFVSGVNADIRKEINYISDKVISIYDSRKPNKKILFEYNENNLPIKVSKTNSNIFHTFEYSGNKLIKIYRENETKKELVHEFNYENDLIKYIINNKDLKALKLDYLLNKLNKITYGAMKENLITSNNTSEEYCNDDVYLNEGRFVTESDEILIGKELVMPDDYIQGSNTYVYEEGYTEVKNEKDISIRYYFDNEGRELSNLEYNKDDLPNIHMLTLSKPSGWNIDKTGTTNVFINDKESILVNKSNNKYTLLIENEKIDNFISDLNNNESLLEYFNLSFWLMFKTNNDSNNIAKISYKLNNELITKQVKISNTLKDVWQNVSISFELDENYETLSDLKIIIESDESKNIQNDGIYIADIRINKGNLKTICIDSAEEEDDSYLELAIGKDLYYFSDGSEHKVTLSEDFYLTENDVISTYRSLFYSIKNGKSNYDLFYCNKTKVMSVNYVSLLPYYLTNDTSIREKQKYYKFTFNKYKNGSLLEGDKANYRFCVVNLVSVEENKKTYYLTEIERNVLYDENRKRYKFKTTVTNGEASSKYKLVNNNKKVSSITVERDDGLEISQKYYKQIYNENGEIEKEYELIYEKEYDDYGNLLKEVTKTSSEELVKEYVYYEETNRNRELIKEIKEDGNTILINYNDKDELEEVVTKFNKEYVDGEVNLLSNEEIVNKVKYTYNDFNELIRVSYYDKSNKLIGENNISYNTQGNVNLLKDKKSEHGFIYDAFSSLTSVYRNKKLVERYNKEISKTNDKNISYLYQGKDTAIITSLYDRYGRIKSYKLNSLLNNETKVVLFEYENNENSQQLSRIKKITDNLINEVTEYEYLDTSNDGTTAIITKGDYSIETKANGNKTYNISNEKTKCKALVLDNMNNNLAFVYNYQEDEKIEELSYDYSYDELNRLKSKKTKAAIYDNLSYQETQDNEYYSNSNLLKKKETTLTTIDSINNTNKKVVVGYENSYKNGNVIKIKETKKRLEYGTLSSEIKEETVEYTYDSLNRLIKETNSNNEIEYVYNEESNMLEKIKKNGEVIKAYEEVSGRLTKVEENDTILNIEYDNYGNVTKIGNKEITYNNQNLVEKIKEGNTEYLYEYNYQGIRTKKQKKDEYEIKYYLDGRRIIGEELIDSTTSSSLRKMLYYYDESGISGINYKIGGANNYYRLIKDTIGNVRKVVNEGKVVGEYKYDGWGNSEVIVTDEATSIDRSVVINNPFRYKGYYYDVETELFYCNSRYYSPKLCRWISPDDIEYLDPSSINGLNLYCYCYNNPVNYKQRPVSSGCSVVSSSISVGVSSLFARESSGSRSLNSVGNPSAPGWLSTAVGAIPDFILGMKYLVANGMHSKFAYATNTRYMHPIMGGTWRWFGKSSSSFGTIAQGTFKQILTGDARAGFGAIARSVGSTVGLNAIVNFGFNFYENNWQIDSSMLVDTAIDTAIGVSSYYLAAGTMSLATAGLLAAGVALPGIVVVGGVVILSIGFEHVIRAISNYWD